MGWAAEVLDFWFGLEPGRWWKADPALDAEVRERFLPLWKEKRSSVPAAFLGSADEALAGAILFDQFPRNMFRGEADQYSTDPLAIAIAKGAVEAGLDQAVDPARRLFLYMPFMHSEDSADQERSLLLFTALGAPDQLKYAHRHHDVIARFGRFPHRNSVLGRTPRADEIAAGNVEPF